MFVLRPFLVDADFPKEISQKRNFFAISFTPVRSGFDVLEALIHLLAGLSRASFVQFRIQSSQARFSSHAVAFAAELFTGIFFKLFCYWKNHLRFKIFRSLTCFHVQHAMNCLKLNKLFLKIVVMIKKSFIGADWCEYNVNERTIGRVSVSVKIRGNATNHSQKLSKIVCFGHAHYARIGEN